MQAEFSETSDGSTSAMIWGVSDGEGTDPGEWSASSPQMQGETWNFQEHLELLDLGVSEDPAGSVRTRSSVAARSFFP